MAPGSRVIGAAEFRGRPWVMRKRHIRYLCLFVFYFPIPHIPLFAYRPSPFLVRSIIRLAKPNSRRQRAWRIISVFIRLKQCTKNYQVNEEEDMRSNISLAQHANRLKMLTSAKETG